MHRLRVGEESGRGMEMKCFRLIDEGGNFSGKCVKVLHRFGKYWQSREGRFWHESLGCAKEVMDPSFAVLDQVELVFSDGRVEREEFVVVEDFYEDYVERVLRLGDFGRDDLAQMMDLIRWGYNLRVNHERGLDLMGGGLVKDVLKGFPQAIILALARGDLREKVATILPGVLGQARNVIRMDDGELVCSDLGMHDLSEGAKFARTNRLYNSIVFAGLIEMVGVLNARLPKEERFSDAEIEELPCVAGPAVQKFAAGLFKLMLPVFECRQKSV